MSVDRNVDQTCKRRNELEQHSITPEALHTLLALNQEVLVFDVRQPLDLLVDPDIIVGAKRIPPKDLLENPTLIPREKHSVVYRTCPNDRTSRVISRRGLAMHFLRIKLLKGGLAGWKEKGYRSSDTKSPFNSILAPSSALAETSAVDEVIRPCQLFGMSGSIDQIFFMMLRGRGFRRIR